MESARATLYLPRLALAAVLALAAGPSTASAQEMGTYAWAVEARTGIAVPAGAWSDQNVDAGLAVGMGIAYRVHPRVVLRVDGDWLPYPGHDFEGTPGTTPGQTVWHLTAGGELELTRPESSRWNVAALLGAGITALPDEEFFLGPSPSPPEGSREIYFTGLGGLRVGYELGRQVRIFVAGRWHLAFTDGEEIVGILGEDFDTVSSVPVTAGLRVRF